MSIIEIVSVNVGKADEIGKLQGQKVVSAIQKYPVSADEIYVGELGLQGDEQVDQSIKDGKQVHGGPQKAVYMYPWEHYPYWRDNLGIELAPGALGENLTVQGITEADVCIGDTVVCGNRTFVVTGHRRPCYKFGLLYPGAPRMMIKTGYCGWYVRVMNPGLMSTTGRIHIFPGAESSMTVLESFRRKKLEDQPIPGPH